MKTINYIYFVYDLMLTIIQPFIYLAHILHTVSVVHILIWFVFGCNFVVVNVLSNFTDDVWKVPAIVRHVVNTILHVGFVQIL